METDTTISPKDIAVLETAAMAVLTYATDYDLLPQKRERQVDPQPNLYTIEYFAAKADEWSVAAGVRQSDAGSEQYIQVSWKVDTKQSGIVNVEISLSLEEGYRMLKARGGRMTIHATEGSPIFAYAQFPRQRGHHDNLLPFPNGGEFTEVGAQEVIKAIVAGALHPREEKWKDKEEVLAAMGGVMTL